MTEFKVFVDTGRFKLTGDSRDVMVPVNYRQDVIEWCNSVGVRADNALNNDNSSIAERYFGVNLWRIRDEGHRILFLLRWS